MQPGLPAPGTVQVPRTFVRTYREGAPALASDIAPPDFAHLGAACHSLRGACGAIGATRLRDQVEAFEHSMNHVRDESALSLEAHSLHEELISLVVRLLVELDPKGTSSS